MHEMTVATSLIREILENVQSLKGADGLGPNVTKVEEVVLEIGELAFISKPQLEFCYDVLARENDLLKGSTLRLVDVPAEVKCVSCGFQGSGDSLDEPVDHRIVMTFTCPRCGETLEIVKGRGMVLRNVSVQVED